MLCNTVRTAAVILVAIAATGCASAPGETTDQDRFEGFNRGVYKFNDTIDRAALKPVAKGYRRITPRWVRIGIGNFFSNLEYPITAFNQFLQGKPGLGFKDTGRFLLNSTLGVAGLLDVASAVGLEANDEDFGQTLAVWGVGSGPFIMMPFLGPTTLRDMPSEVVDVFVDPLTYADVKWELLWGQRALDAVHSRAELLAFEATLERAYDPYAFIRNAWLQQREFQVYDGNPPPETLEDVLGEEDFEAAEE